MIKFNNKINNMSVDDILLNIKSFIEENNINFEIAFSYDSSIMNYDNHFVKFYNYKESCFGNLKIDGFDLNENLNLYKKITSARGLNDGIYLTKKNLVELLDDILTINNMKNLDANKIILGKSKIEKEFKEVAEEKITLNSELNINNIRKLKGYLVQRGIHNLNEEFLKKHFRYLSTDENNQYIMMKTIYNKAFDGYKLPNMDKAKLGYNAPTFINNKQKEVYIFEGKLDAFEIMKKKKEEINYFINNGIHINKKLFETLKNHEKRVFIVDKDIRGIVFFLDTIARFTNKEEEISKLMFNLNKKLLLVIKEFSETKKFKKFYNKYMEIKKLSPLKRKKDDFFNTFQKLQENPYFNNFNTSKGFIVDTEHNKIFDTYELIKFFEDIFELQKNELFPDKIIKSELDKIYEFTDNIGYYIPDNENKDFNERNFKYIKILDAVLTDNKEFLNKYNIPDNINFDKLINNKEELLKLKSKSKKGYIHELLTNYSEYEKLKNVQIKYSFYPNITKILEEAKQEKKKFIYGIDETNTGGSVGNIFISMVYADYDRIKKYLINNINSNFLMKDFISRNKTLKKKIDEINDKIDDKHLLNKLNNLFTYVKNKEDIKILQPYYKLKLLESIKDSKKMQDKTMFEVYDFLNELQEKFLTRIRTVSYEVKNHSNIKTLQKKGFIELINGLPVINSKMRENIKQMIKESNNKPLKKELLEKILTEKKEIIIDGEKIIDIPTKHKIVFEPGADNKYFAVSCASIIARIEELKELNVFIDKLKKFKEPKLDNLINILTTSKGYMTVKHKEILEKTVNELIKDNNNKVLEYLTKIYRLNKATKEILFDKLKELKTTEINFEVV